jgi:hypothetical protein
MFAISAFETARGFHLPAAESSNSRATRQPFQLCRLRRRLSFCRKTVTWLADHGPPDDGSSSASGSGAYLKSGAIFNCAKVTLRTALSGYPRLASVAAGSVFCNIGWLFPESVLASG